MKNALPSLVLLLALTGCSSQDDPTPTAGVVTINLSNSTSWLGMPASAHLCNTPLRTPETGKVLWTDKVTNTKAVFGPVAKGTRLYLRVQFDDVVRPNYLWPAAGESIRAELLVDGKMVRSVLLNAASFNDPTNYFRTDATRVDLVQEVEVEI